MIINEEKKKKVVVLTYHRHDNYGAVLQCYALQRVLKNMQCSPSVIDYICKADLYPWTLEAIKARGLLPCAISIIGDFIRYPRKRKFSKFRKCMRYTVRCDKSSIKSIGDSYDFYIVGSDNVWNSAITGFDKNYFLDFVDKREKRKTYAASFGSTQIPECQKSQYINLLKGIDGLCVREKSGAELISKLIHKEAKVVLDPTLLLSKENWDLLSGDRLIEKPYLFAYQLVPSRGFIKFVKKQAKELGRIPVFTPFPMGGVLKAKNRLSDGPKEWISLLRYADYVITDSFHGCAFSILYGKQFAVYISQMGERIENLLDSLEISNRYVNGHEPFKWLPIDYEKVNNILYKERKNSINILRRELELGES
jgi:hypothetical protein